MNQQIDRSTLAKILQAESLDALSHSELVDLFRMEAGITDFLPDGICQIDPRNGDRILFNSSRARRPHDNEGDASLASDAGGKERTCVVCQGKTTGVVDVADLSEGFTFINKNLYPILYPLASDRLSQEGRIAWGFHFLQWTSSLHEKDWHNMSLADRVVVMQRLAALEQKLLCAPDDTWTFCGPSEERGGRRGFVSIIKNYGRLVGGSLAHGHQQIALSNVMPGQVRNHRLFERERGEVFSSYMMRENPPGLVLRDYGAALLLVPYFMRRPYDMMLLVKDTDKAYLCQLNRAEVEAIAEGWHDAIRVIHSIMPQIGREIAYNVVTHNGPGAGLYFDFLPYSQEIGGFEHRGLFVCQGKPEDTANRIRACLEQWS